MKTASHFGSAGSCQQIYCLRTPVYLQVSAEFQMQNHCTYLWLCTLVIQDLYWRPSGINV